MRSLRRSGKAIKADAAAGIGEGRVLAVTEAALLVGFGKSSSWIPRRVVHAVSELRPTAIVGDSGRLFVAAWFARSKGWA